MKKTVVALLVTALTISCCSGVGVSASSALKKPSSAVYGQSSAVTKKSAGAIEKSGTGNAVIKNVKVASRGAVAQITHDGVGKFVVSQHPSGGKKSVLVDTTGACNKSVKLSGGTSRFDVEADGAWSITISTSASSGKAPASSKRSSTKPSSRVDTTTSDPALPSESSITSVDNPTVVNRQAPTQKDTQAIPANVWRTRTGSKYHSHSGCGTTKNATQITRQQAEASGLDPCSKCF